jgi:REP element-mobilizing transposase RayT
MGNVGGGVGMKGDRFYKTWGKSRSVRLENFRYEAPGVVYHVIIGSRDKAALFVNEKANKHVLQIAEQACSIHRYELLAFCLMPDHLHLLVRSQEGAVDLRFFVRAMKSFCTRTLGGRIWQKGFYEHVMRTGEDVKKTAEYIINNPVRKGLVQRAEDYPWGSIVAKW